MSARWRATIDGKRGRRAWLAGGAGALVAFAWPRLARPAMHEMRLVVPFPPGGASDRVARTLAGPLGEVVGARVVVENVDERSGVASFANAAPDGRTLLLGSTGSVVLAPLSRTPPPFDPRRDLAPVCLIGGAPAVLTVHPSLPVRRLDELVAHQRQRPGDLVTGSPGPGTVPHLAGLLFARRTGIAVRHREFAGSAPLLDAHVRGEVHVAFESQVVERVRAGQLRALAVMGSARSAALKDVPTVSEAGVPGIDVGTWLAVLAPRGTPEPVCGRLADQVRRALADPGFAAQAPQGLELRPGSPDQLARFLAADVERWSRYLRELGIVVALPGADGGPR